MSVRNLGGAIAVGALALDQATKAWMIHALARGPRVLLPVFDLQLAWNTGVSYSLLRADGPWGRILLVAAALAAAVALTVWLFRARHRLTGAALGLLIGGALGNALDRGLTGAVTDFFHLHWGGFAPFGVFNVADVAITGGVVLLLVEGLLVGNRDAGTSRKGSSLPIDSANNLP